ncbi:GNAT family N-acetyltransferase [Streptomyces sp. NPDC006372]|uniref:GNAT family N-acetyltransferase n=1 Tax=Streptomyces sp. NPDC006372 TaxID=3155599 RepID=UPI0033A008AB
MPPTLRTRRLLLDAYTPADEEGFVALFQEPRVSRWMGSGTASEAEDRALFGRIFSKVYARDLFDVWAVRRDGLLVGHAEVKRGDEVDGHEIVYALAPEVWGGGLGTELVEALVDHGFDTLALTEVHATVDARNTASLRLLGRVGFEHVRDLVEDDGSLTRVLTCRNSVPSRAKRS